MTLHFAAFVLAAGCVTAQPFPTHVVMDSLLRIRFYPATGGFSMDSPIPVLFPPPGETPARLLIKKSGGGAVVTKDVVIRPWAPYEAFGEMRAKDNQDQFGPIPPGDYVMSVELKGKEISAYSFSMKPQGSPDPFNPKTEFVRTGPWSKTAFLTALVEVPVPLAGIGMYISTREFPGFVIGKPAPFSVHLLRGGTQIGLIESTAHTSDWAFFKEDFQVGRGKGFVKWSDVTATAGVYAVELRSGGKTVRSYKFNVAGGKVTLIPANEPSFAGSSALPAQTLLNNRRTQAFWLATID
jgi:hypothetical protein